MGNLAASKVQFRGLVIFTFRQGERTPGKTQICQQWPIKTVVPLPRSRSLSSKHWTICAPSRKTFTTTWIHTKIVWCTCTIRYYSLVLITCSWSTLFECNVLFEYSSNDWVINAISILRPILYEYTFVVCSRYKIWNNHFHLLISSYTGNLS